MNIAQAKQISLEDFLARLGHRPTQQKSGQLWYCSPLRNESKPSFKVNPTRNVWYDFGQAKGGDLIDLVRQMEQCTTVSETLDRIEQIYGAPPPSQPMTTSKLAPEPESTPLELIRLQPVTSIALKNYLLSRGIDPQKVSNFVQEARYRRDDKEYFALAFQNQKHGYELRNPHFKGTLGNKAISIIEGTSAIAFVFEGFMDYLTAVMMQSVPDDATVLVLNSVGLRDHAVAAINALRIESVELYHDHDDAGAALASYLIEALPNIAFHDRSGVYSGYNDLNEYLMAQLPARVNSRR